MPPWYVMSATLAFSKPAKVERDETCPSRFPRAFRNYHGMLSPQHVWVRRGGGAGFHSQVIFSY